MPFSGSDKSAKAATPPPADSGGSTSWVSWPSLPSFPGTSSSTTKADEAKAKAKHGILGNSSPNIRERNAWTQTKPKPEPKKTMTATMWDSVTNAPHTVAQSTKKAYHKTVNAITPGESNPAPRVAQRDTGTSWWSKMTGSGETAPEEPRTVTEWMAQERPKQ